MISNYVFFVHPSPFHSIHYLRDRNVNMKNINYTFYNNENEHDDSDCYDGGAVIDRSFIL